MNQAAIPSCLTAVQSMWTPRSRADAARTPGDSGFVGRAGLEPATQGL